MSNISKKILFISTRPLEANVSSSIRKKATIQGLLAAGAQVTLLTTRPLNQASNYDSSLEIKNVKLITIPTGMIYSSFTNKANKSKSLYSSLFKKIKKIGREIYLRTSIYDSLTRCLTQVNNINDSDLENEEYDAIISVSDPKSSHLLAIKLIEEKKVKYKHYIQIWGDPMYADITNKYLGFKSRLKKEEEKLISKADLVLYVSPLTLNEQKKIFPKHEKKMRVLLPPYVEENIYKNNNSIQTVAYFGDYHSHIRNILPLYNAIKELDDFKLLICGNSNVILEEQKNIKIMKRQPFEEVKRMESNVDLLVHISNNSGRQIPGKIYQYMGTNKPILFILDGYNQELYDFFSRYNRCVFCNNDEKDIRETLVTIQKNGYQQKAEPVPELSYISIGKKLLDYLSEIENR